MSEQFPIYTLCEFQTNPAKQQLALYKSQHVQLNRTELIYCNRSYILYDEKLSRSKTQSPPKTTRANSRNFVI